MPHLLTPQETVLLQQDTDYLNVGIGIWQSRVVLWDDRIILIYHTESQGYVVSDITDLPIEKIAELAKQSNVHGIWYYLPQSIMDIVSEETEKAIESGISLGDSAAKILENAAAVAGQTIANVLTPTVETLTLPLIIAGIVLLVYLFKKG